MASRSVGVRSWALGVLWALGVGRWVRAGSPPGRWVGDHLFSGSSIHRSKAPVKQRRSCTRQRGRRTVGVARRAFAVGVGWTAGSPRGRAFKKKALGRSLAAGFAPPWLVHLFWTSPPPPTSPPDPTSPPPPPIGREREPRAPGRPLKTPQGPNGAPTRPI